MRIPRVFHDGYLQPDTEVELANQASQHLLRVLRLNVGDKVYLFNGQGGEYHAEIIRATKNTATVRVITYKEIHNESPLRIHLAQGISRGERMDFVIQKAVELGVDTITPLFTERCGVKLTSEREQKRIEHWRNVAISACEQSGRCIVPTINAPLTLNEWLQQNDSLCLVCDPLSAKKISEIQLKDKLISVLIGPEGGLSEKELEHARQNGTEALSLGPRILRTETAAIAALVALQMQWGDLNA